MTKRKYVIMGILVLIATLCVAFFSCGLKKKNQDKENTDSNNNGLVIEDSEELDEKDEKDNLTEQEKEENKTENQASFEELFGTEAENDKDNQESNVTDRTENGNNSDKNEEKDDKEDNENTEDSDRWGPLL